ncbi:PDZ domain-containing protein [Deinococcus yavapaiensis KR-236]|uniref:PDZ domain-containing protein n=1 Tax=Deinococcus yavapaiensis KR-236 TaxID=694435 RepID=A0A318SG21_9DEIO|nr:PDZ domain-containing protein [Deinococcus yavapaiensis KR-236]
MIRRFVQLTLSTLILGFAAQAVPVSGTLTGAIVDWPKGKAGEVRLVHNGFPLAKGRVDEQGVFHITLPTSKELQSIYLVPVTTLFFNSEQDCQGKVTVTPEDATGDQFQLDVYQGDKRLGNISMFSAPQIPSPAGSYAAMLVLQRSPTSMKGRITCEHIVQDLDWKLAAGWNFLLLERKGLNQNGLDERRFTNQPLPKSLVWRIYRTYAGAGFEFDMIRRRSDSVFVTDVMPGKPAEKAGLKVGDEIVEVDGRSLKGLNNRTVRERLQGTPGSQFTVSVRRGVGAALMRITMTRVALQED